MRKRKHFYVPYILKNESAFLYFSLSANQVHFSQFFNFRSFSFPLLPSPPPLVTHLLAYSLSLISLTKSLLQSLTPSLLSLSRTFCIFFSPFLFLFLLPHFLSHITIVLPIFRNCLVKTFSIVWRTIRL